MKEGQAPRYSANILPQYNPSQIGICQLILQFKLAKSQIICQPQTTFSQHLHANRKQPDIREFYINTYHHKIH